MNVFSLYWAIFDKYVLYENIKHLIRVLASKVRTIVSIACDIYISERIQSHPFLQKSCQTQFFIELVICLQLMQK